MQKKTALAPRFHNGAFRVLMLSDIQERADFDLETKRDIGRLLDKTRPDFVLLGGDNCFGPDIRTRRELDAFLRHLTEPLETRGILWAHIFGNHDHDVKCVSADALQARYEAFPHCLSRHSRGIHGVTNYSVDILGADGHPAFRLWMLDTNGKLEDSALNGRFGEKGLAGAAVLPMMNGNTDRYDIVYFDQLEWYYRQSKALEKREGRLVPGLMAAHIAPEEFSLAMMNPLETGLRGAATERLAPAALNSGLFSLLVQRGDVRCLACGHTHMDAFQARYLGIEMCFDACAGHTCYGLPDERGGRVFDLDESTGAVSTYMAYYREL